MKKKKQDSNYIPKNYEVVDNIDREKYSDDEIEVVRKEVEAQDKCVKGLSVVSVIWTFISTVYAIASTCVLISRRWVESKISYVLIGILVLYVGIFIGVAVAAFTSPKEGKKNMKGLKTTLKFLKPIMSIVLVALAVTELVAVAVEPLSIPRVIVMSFTMFVAFVQLVLRVLLVFAQIRAKKIAKGYRVRLERYVDGKKRKKGLATKIKEKQYSD